MNNSSLILALDVGTSSVRAALYNERAERLDETFVKNSRQLTITDEGGAEINADEALKQVIEAIDAVLIKAGENAKRIEYVTASSFWHSLVGVDSNGDALTPVYGWADTRSAEFVQTLRENFDEQVIHNRTGCRFHPSYWTAKLLWLKTEQPEIFNKVDKWLSFSDFMFGRHFSEYTTSVSQASGTGIFDIRKCDWDDNLIHFLGVKREQLPRIADDKETLKFYLPMTPDGGEYVRSDEYARWHNLENAKWFPAIGDGAANNVGANCVTKNRAALMIGTSGAMRVIYEGEPPDKIPMGLWCYRLDRKRIVIGGALSDGGGLYAWFKDNLKLIGTDDEIENLIAALPPDGHGLTFLPFLAGERSTNWNGTATGAILGLKSATSAVEITQAALESVAYRFAAIFEQLCTGVCPLNEIIASGGALRESPVWTQIICDSLNKPMFLPDEREASSRGAVLLALEHAGKINNISDLTVPNGQEFKPDPTKHTIYQTARQRQEDFYEILFK